MPAVQVENSERHSTRLPAQRRSLLLILALLCAFGAILLMAACVPTTTAHAAGTASPTVRIASSTGGAVVGTPEPSGGIRDGAPVTSTEPAKPNKPRRSLAPVITHFALGRKSLFDEGATLPVTFRIKARHKDVQVWLVARLKNGRRIGAVGLGLQPSGKLQTVRVSEDQFGITADGSYQLRLSVRDKRGRRAARAAGIDTWLGLRFSNHRFPVVGSFSFGGAGSRFNSARPGHKHQGQDISAAEGTPLVAPHAGVISWVSFQAAGAGLYAVLDSSGEDRDYVFMHLKTNSLLVKKGDHVVTGQQLAQVGTTGVSSGPHLHFEIWTGGHWFDGGHPVDPLPILQQWFGANPGGATQQLQSLSEQPQPVLDAPATP